MVLRNLRRKAAAPAPNGGQEEAGELRASLPGVQVQPIGEAKARHPITVVGDVVSVRTVPKSEGSPWLEATISDDTGRLIALWTGRRQIAGVRVGQRMLITGRPSPSGPGGRLMIYNPNYELL